MPSSAPPLSRIRVLDLSIFTPGPFASQILADLGATVLKVEAPPHGDRERDVMPAYFEAYNRGKASIALDLKKPDDLKLCHDLAREADIVIEGFRPGVCDRLGVGFARIAEINPKVIYISLTGFGVEGPYKMARAHDPEIQAITGSLHYSRDRDGKAIYNFAYPTFDYAASMYSVIGALSWLGVPDRSAVRVDVPLAAAGVAWMFPQYVNAIGHDARTFADNNDWRGSYRTRDGRYITLTPAEGLRELLEEMGITGLAGRGRETMEAIADAIAQRDADEIVPLLQRLGVPVGLAQTVDEAVHDPGLNSLGMLHGFDGQGPMACASPIMGMATRLLKKIPSIDGQGALVRQGGWTALEAARKEWNI
ncbi:CoA-transferase family III [Sphingobium faniae]|nr:CoA-transferase family III [Sphingobium faniae]